MRASNDAFLSATPPSSAAAANASICADAADAANGAKRGDSVRDAGLDDDDDDDDEDDRSASMAELSDTDMPLAGAATAAAVGVIDCAPLENDAADDDE